MGGSNACSKYKVPLYKFSNSLKYGGKSSTVGNFGANTGIILSEL
jgi:hypothetical protein